MQNCYLKELNIQTSRKCYQSMGSYCKKRQCLPLDYEGVSQIFYPIGLSDMPGGKEMCYQGTKEDTIHQTTIDKIVRKLK